MSMCCDKTGKSSSFQTFEFVFSNLLAQIYIFASAVLEILQENLNASKLTLFHSALVCAEEKKIVKQSIRTKAKLFTDCFTFLLL